jgi:hypothetical protein
MWPEMKSRPIISSDLIWVKHRSIGAENAWEIWPEMLANAIKGLHMT